MCFGRGLHWPTPTSSYGVEEGVAVIGAEAPPLLVPAIKVRAPVLEVSEDLSRELDGQAFGGLPWDGARGGESWRRGFPQGTARAQGCGAAPGLHTLLVPRSGSRSPLYDGGKDVSVPPTNTHHLFSGCKQTVSKFNLPCPGGPGGPIPHALPHLPPQTQRDWALPHHTPCT